ncbi:TetR/AcrR family transcriptional regulator [Ihubacter massiliensis]|uniref:TetR/AcrR family transcriptional regulator n=1 Tax=Hominibacterium faecale TaxID=2839743 RepID=A0A9J6QZQ2_9FIRM|nr:MULTISPECIES: TetR/AcrR family transcriptional regulator [Eubacteriales Family XIII. Incertae Sedis]MCO7120408.1 TetR/AcrR family transcriptional regulator [Ihubacter massiliensis]MCU7381014.1 TetR/AcrR family transcriptional regulator [Hominibacterium faecale]
MSRNKYPEVTVNRILDSATKLFLQKGYEKTTIQDIVNDLGDLSKGAIYHHFSSKEDIIQAVGERMYANVDFASMFKGREDQLTGLEKLKEICLTCMTSVQQHQLMEAVPDYYHNPKFLAQEVFESVKHSPQMLLPYIEEGVEDGSITVSQPKEAAEVFLLLINIWINPLVFHETRAAFTEKVRFLKTLLDQIGLPVMDEKVMAAALSYGECLDD